MIDKLRPALISLGLNEKEALIMGALYNHQSTKASELARETRLNRSTAYAILRSLIKKGLATSVVKYGLSEFQPIPPGLLPTYVERQKERLANSEKELKKIIPEIKLKQENLGVLPRVTFYEGPEGVKQAYEDTLDNNKNKIIYVFSGPDIVFKELGREYVAYYVNKRKRLGIKSLQIAPATAWGQFIKSRDAAALRVTQLIPAEFSFDTEMVMYDSKLGIFAFSQNHLMAVIIENDAIVKTLLTLFRYISEPTRKER